MVAHGTFNELQGSGLDFTSLLKEETYPEEERQTMTPGSGMVSHCSHTLSNISTSSLSSLSSSRYSLKDGTESHAVVGNFNHQL